MEEEDQHCDTKARLQQNQSMRYVLGSNLPQLPQSVHETLYIALNILYHKIEIYSMSIATALYRLATFFHKMFLTGPNRTTSKIYAIANVIVIFTVTATLSGTYLGFQFLFSLTNISVLKMCNLHDTNLFFMRRASLKLPSMHVYITFY